MVHVRHAHMEPRLQKLVSKIGLVCKASGNKLETKAHNVIHKSTTVTDGWETVSLNVRFDVACNK